MQKLLKFSVVLLLCCFCVFLETFALILTNNNVIYASTEKPTITFTYSDKEWTYLAKEHESDNFCFTARGQRFHRWGTPSERAKLLTDVRKLGFTAEQSLNYCFLGIDEILQDLKKTINRPAKDATYTFNPNKSSPFTFTKEEVGYQLNFDDILAEISTKLQSSGNVKIELKPVILQPNVFYDDIKDFANLRSSFYTTFNDNVTNRKHNIVLATKSLNGLKMESNTEYSFNQTTGRRSEANGYKPANIIVDKKYVEGYGGGVCQVSTTLYNALLLAGMEIREVHSHSLASSYVNMGFDAMVNYGTSDLRWANNTGSPMFLRGFVSGNQVYFEVYGKPDSHNRTLKRVTEIEKTIEPPTEQVIIDDKGEYQNLVQYSDESAYITSAKNGYKVRAILEIYEGEKLVERKLLRRVTYQAVRGVKVVGAKTRPEPEPEQTPQDVQVYGELSDDIVNFWQNLF